MVFCSSSGGKIEGSRELEKEGFFSGVDALQIICKHFFGL